MVLSTHRGLPARTVTVPAHDHPELPGYGRTAGQWPRHADPEPLRFHGGPGVVMVGGRRPVLDDSGHRPGQVELGVTDRQRHEARAEVDDRWSFRPALSSWVPYTDPSRVIRPSPSRDCL